MRTLIKNIGQIVGITDQQTRRKAGVEMSVTRTLDNAWLLIEDGLISGFGPMSDCPCSCEVIDAEGGMILPCFCDSEQDRGAFICSDCSKRRWHPEFCGSAPQDFGRRAVLSGDVQGE